MEKSAIKKAVNAGMTFAYSNYRPAERVPTTAVEVRVLGQKEKAGRRPWDKPTLQWEIERADGEDFKHAGFGAPSRTILVPGRMVLQTWEDYRAAVRDQRAAVEARAAAKETAQQQLTALVADLGVGRPVTAYGRGVQLSVDEARGLVRLTRPVTREEMVAAMRSLLKAFPMSPGDATVALGEACDLWVR